MGFEDAVLQVLMGIRRGEMQTIRYMALKGRLIKRLLSFSPCIFWGRGLFSAKSWGLVPLARPITTVGERRVQGRRPLSAVRAAKALL